jgi:hypothetical protein
MGVFLSLSLIIVSFLVDLLSLPNLLMKSEKGFEHKYLEHLEDMNEAQNDNVLAIFLGIFYQNFYERFAGKSMTMMQSML